MLHYTTRNGGFIMSSIQSDPIRSVLNLTRRSVSRMDLLNQSILICFGLWLLDAKTIFDLYDRTIYQSDFKAAVCRHLERTDPEAAASFQAYFQGRPLTDSAFQRLFDVWLEFIHEKNMLCRLTDRMIYPHLSRLYQPELAVPEWLERLACELLPDTGGTFYDGTAGAGGMALRAAHCWQGKKLPLQVVTGEADPLLFHLSVLRAKMHGLKFRQTNADCLKSSEHYGCGMADISVMFPPLQGGRPVSVCVSESVLCGSDWIYAYCQLVALKETGVGVCRIPNGALFGAKNQKFRKYLLDLNVIDAVISLSKSSTPFWASASAASLVVFRKGRKEDDAVRMMEVPGAGSSGQKNEFSNMSGRQIKRLLEAGGKWIHRSELDASNLSPRRYLSSFRRNGGSCQTGFSVSAQDKKDSQGCNSVELGEVAAVYRGLNVAKLSRCAEGAGVLRLSDVQDGRICMDDIARYDLSGRKDTDRYQIRAGDVLLSCKGKAVKLCVVPEDMSLLLSHDFLGIRADSGKVDPQYLYYYLQSPVGQQLIKNIQMGSSITMIRAADLEHLMLHYISLALQKQYASELHQANALIDRHLDALNASKQQVYGQFYQKIKLGNNTL